MEELVWNLEGLGRVLALQDKVEECDRRGYHEGEEIAPGRGNFTRKRTYQCKDCGIKYKDSPRK